MGAAAPPPAPLAEQRAAPWTPQARTANAGSAIRGRRERVRMAGFLGGGTVVIAGEGCLKSSPRGRPARQVDFGRFPRAGGLRRVRERQNSTLAAARSRAGSRARSRSQAVA